MSTTIAIDRPYVVRTLTELVRINSVNPSLSPEGAGEREIAAYISSSLSGAGLRTAIHEPQPGRPTVVGTLAGTGGGRSLMLNGHADTVGVDGMPDPFAAAVRGGRLYGRGAHDMKGGLAASLAAAKALVESGLRLRGDLVIAAVADEEYGSLGTTDLLGRYPVDAAIVVEPTELEICLAHKGYIWFSVETTGRAAHGSRFWEGTDANMRMGRLLARLDELEQQLRARAPHPLVGPPSLHAAMLNGGSGLSTYAARCTLKIERRTVPGETEATARQEIQTIIDRLREADPSFHATVESFFVRRPFEASPDSRIVQTLGTAAREVLGRQPAFVGDSPWMDAALLSEAGIETVVMGPRGAGEHSAEEWVDLDSVCQMADVLARTAAAYCG